MLVRWKTNLKEEFDMRPWFLGFCVAFTLVTPMAKKLLAEARIAQPNFATARAETTIESISEETEYSDDAELGIND